MVHVHLSKEVCLLHKETTLNVLENELRRVRAWALSYWRRFLKQDKMSRQWFNKQQPTTGMCPGSRIQLESDFSVIFRMSDREVAEEDEMAAMGQCMNNRAEKTYRGSTDEHMPGVSVNQVHHCILWELVSMALLVVDAGRITVQCCTYMANVNGIWRDSEHCKLRGQSLKVQNGSNGMGILDM